MKFKSSKCGHIAYRIYPEPDGNECYDCGWNKYYERPEAKEYIRVQRITQFTRLPFWIYNALMHEWHHKHLPIKPKHRVNALGINLMPLGGYIDPCAGTIVLRDEDTYFEDTNEEKQSF